MESAKRPMVDFETIQKTVFRYMEATPDIVYYLKINTYLNMAHYITAHFHYAPNLQTLFLIIRCLEWNNITWCKGTNLLKNSNKRWGWDLEFCYEGAKILISCNKKETPIEWLRTERFRYLVNVGLPLHFLMKPKQTLIEFNEEFCSYFGFEQPPNWFYHEWLSTNLATFTTNINNNYNIKNNIFEYYYNNNDLPPKSINDAIKHPYVKMRDNANCRCYIGEEFFKKIP